MSQARRMGIEVLCSVHPPILAGMWRRAEQNNRAKWRTGNGQFTNGQFIERCPFSRLTRRIKHANMRIERLSKVKLQVRAVQVSDMGIRKPRSGITLRQIGIPWDEWGGVGVGFSVSHKVNARW